MPIQTLLIANRGEIALRIMHSARSEGYRIAAVYSDTDREALHVRNADVAFALGGNTPAESYLDINKIIAAAKKVGADAIHPGYGFLAENAEFARACEANNIVFIGPSPEVIELMGNKRRAKEFVQAVGVPCVPGFQGEQNEKILIEQADKIGFPLMIKAAAGGGGRGMRLVHRIDELPEQLRSARSEAQSAFGSGELILERALSGTRHIEIQIFADSFSNVIHLGERDCSIQRRHQKIVEESPSPAVGETLRQKMGAAAVAVAKACNYLGAGTVEFLLDNADNFYFLEMNTRLQVEHPVTEMVTGQDLVAWQLAVAHGKPLPLGQEQIRRNGHAIEVRLYAEDTNNNFLPQTGRVLHWQEPVAAGIRADHGIFTDLEVSPYYDSMLGKIIAHGETREAARHKLCRALDEMQFVGPATNRFFLRQILQDEIFIKGAATTTFVDQQFAGVSSGQLQPSPQIIATAAVLRHEQQLTPMDKRSGRANWRSGDNSLPLHYTLQCNDNTYGCRLFCCGGHNYRAQINNEKFEITVLRQESQHVQLIINGVQSSQFWLEQNNSLYLVNDGHQWQFRDHSHEPTVTCAREGDGRITAPMDGCIVEVFVQAGQPVRRGELLAVMEAMKMEHPLKANSDGTIVVLEVRDGDQVCGGQLLVQIEALEDHPLP